MPFCGRGIEGDRIFKGEKVDVIRYRDDVLIKVYCMASEKVKSNYIGYFRICPPSKSSFAASVWVMNQ